MISTDPRAYQQLTTPCPNDAVAPFGNAYRWVRQHAPPGAVVYVFAGTRPLFRYCLWNADFSYRVETVAPIDESAFRDLLDRAAPVLLFLPRDAPAQRYYQRNAARFSAGFDDGAVRVVVVK